jgi:hypothetical protein
MSPEHLSNAMRFNLCWVCGNPNGKHVTFVSGPMCGVNRTSAEPPSHYDCARWSAEHCPFLANPNKERRVGALPAHTQMPGIGILRNPGVTLLWTTSKGWGYEVVRPNGPIGGGILYRMGEPERVEWLRYGRSATRSEVIASIRAGLPELKRYADTRPVRDELARLVRQLRPWLP